jgi:hypothetical protein
VLSSFVDRLQNLHPNNKHVKDKIRQQVLRDEGVVKFVNRGHYLLRIEPTLFYKNITGYSTTKKPFP